jgi:hypothetical protein
MSCKAAARPPVSSLDSARDKVADLVTSVQGWTGRIGAAAIAALASCLPQRDQPVTLAAKSGRVLTTSDCSSA